MLLTIVVFLLILSVLVLIHEAGHFFVAKFFGIKVEEFGFGFPPKAFSIRRGETEYSINWLPIGGFVKLYGEDDAGGGRIASSQKQVARGSDISRAFFARPVWQRALVVVAGVVMNIFLAAFIFYLFLGMSNFMVEIPLLSSHTFVGVNQKDYNLNPEDLVVSMVAKNSPAEKAGMQGPLLIGAVNGKTIADRTSFIKIVDANKGKVLRLDWIDLKTGKKMTSIVTPRLNPPEGEGSMGVGFFPISILRYETFSQKLFSGFSHTANITTYTVSIMSKLVGLSVAQRNAGPLSESVSGPIGIGVLVGEILQLPTLNEKIMGALNLAGLLSVSLAFFNILPIPALDGGRLFFILFEGIFGKKINQKHENLAHTIGMVVLLGLIILITFRDIFRFLIP